MGIKTKLNPLGGNGIVPYESSFQFKVRQNSLDTGVGLEFLVSYSTDFILRIDWGDNTVYERECEPSDAASISVFILRHNYNDITNDYIISISSSKNIMPKFDARLCNDSFTLLEVITPPLTFAAYEGFEALFYIDTNLDIPVGLVTVCDNLFVNNPSCRRFRYLFGSQTSLQTSYVNIINDLYKTYQGESIDISSIFYKVGSTSTMTQEDFEEYTSKYYDITGSLEYAYHGFQFSSFPFNFSNYSSETSFNLTFANCNNLTSIPEGLFQYNTAATNFYSTFSSCSGLTTIPEGLFQYNTKAHDFGYAFNYCQDLTSIPEGLFQYNTEAVVFDGTFANCNNLTSIPEGLFQYNTKVIGFASCFSRSTFSEPLTINSNIFCNEATDMSTRFTSAIQVSFAGCFKANYSARVNGTAPKLWKYTYLQSPVSINCFGGGWYGDAYSLTNWNYIPTNWGGPYSWVVIKSYPEATVEFITDSETEIENPDEPYGIGVVEDSSVTYTVSKTGFNTITNTVTATGYDVYEVKLEPTNKTLIQQYTYLSTVPETLVDGNNFIINEDLLAITSGPSSYHISTSASYGYLQITVPENSFYYVEINAYVSSWASIYNSSLSNLRGSIGGAVITSEPYQPNMKEAIFKLPREGFIFNEYGNNTSKLYTRTLSTGTHYLNFFYVKQNSSSQNEDRLIIDSINIYQADL